MNIRYSKHFASIGENSVTSDPTGISDGHGLTTFSLMGKRLNVKSSLIQSLLRSFPSTLKKIYIFLHFKFKGPNFSSRLSRLLTMCKPWKFWKMQYIGLNFILHKWRVVAEHSGYRFDNFYLTFKKVSNRLNS